jgi:hypothetical protein
MSSGEDFTNEGLNRLCLSHNSNSYEKVKAFKYLCFLLINQNPIHEEIKCRLRVIKSRRWTRH